MPTKKHQNLIRVSAILVLLVMCVCVFCSCHVFAWYIPKPYNDEQMDKIYHRLKSQLADLSHIIAHVGFEQDGLGYNYSIFQDEGKTIIGYDAYKDFETAKRGLYYDGTYKEWDVESRTETVTSKSMDDFTFLFDTIRSTADFFCNKVLNVMPYRDDSYCWQCFPWDVGMAQMYYLPDDDSTVSASWTIENNYKSSKFPLIFEASYSYGNQTDSVGITTYNDFYGINERIVNIQASYEEDKERDMKMLYKQIYVKGLEDVLTLELYNNNAARALFDKLAEGDVTFTVDDYGGFEKVGALGFDLPTCDEQITTSCGDVMLYQGNQISIFYGQNSWSYTPIGYIAGYSESAFKDVIRAGEGKVELTLSLNRD